MRYACALVLLVAAGTARADDCHSNLMIVLDRSCSMNMPPKPGGAKTKWQLAGEALQTVTTKYVGQLDFGLIMFPDQTGQDCNQDGPIYVNVGPANESMVVSKVMGTMPTGPCVTNIKPAFDQVPTDPKYAMPYTGAGPRGFVLFISDGQQTCGGNDNMIAASIAQLYTNGYPTYIVGFGGQVDPAALTSFAMAGGVPRKGSGDGGVPAYYQADDAAQLNAALDEIVGLVSTAEFGGCPGIPCPDGRCFLAGQTCTSGFCQTPGTGNGDGGGTGGNGDGGGGTGGNGSSSGCNCHMGGVASGVPVFAIALFALVLIARGRRRS